MMKFNKYFLIVVLFLIAGGGFLFCPKEKATAQTTGGGWKVDGVVNNVPVYQATELNMQASLMVDMIKIMINEGIPLKRLLLPERTLLMIYLAAEGLMQKLLFRYLALVPPHLVRGGNFFLRRKKMKVGMFMAWALLLI